MDDHPEAGTRGAAADLYGNERGGSRRGARPHREGEPGWDGLFGRIADNVVRTFSPLSVFDAGCGAGLLVEALWDRGVEARGRDVSVHALDQVRPDVRPYCEMGSITDPIDGRYDLVTCLEVLEHLDGDEADLAVGRLTAVTDTVLFSSASIEPGEPAHPTVRPLAYWLRRFAAHGFAPVLSHDASYVSPQAVVLARSAAPVPDDVILGAAGMAGLRVRLAGLSAREEPRAGPAAVEVEVEVERELEQRFSALARELHAEREALTAARAELRALEETKVLRYSRQLRRVYGSLRSATRPAPKSQQRPLMPLDPLYDLWVSEFDTLDASRRRTLESRLSSLTSRPLVSILVPVYDTPEHYLREAFESVLGQIYDNWELCAVDDCSTAEWVPELLEEYAARDPRVRVARRQTNGHISAASNTALEHARGEWIALLDHDDVLSEHALALAVLHADGHPEAGLLYSDEDKIDDAGHRSVPFFKPDFDPLLLLAQNYVCHLTMARRDLVEAAGGFRQGFEGSQDWDLVLRVAERLEPEQVVHVPHVLYHWRAHAGSTAAAREVKPYATRAGARAVTQHLDRLGKDVDVVVNDATGIVRAKWRLPDPSPKVSIVIPTRDGKYLARCLESLFATTVYPDFEVVIVDNGSESAEAKEIFQRYGDIATIVSDGRPFNFSALNNGALGHCAGDVLCFMNDDCEVTEYGWLEEMVSQLSQERTGVVGAKLLYPDGRIQHAGVVLGMGGVAGHPSRLSDRLAYGHFGWLQTPRSLSAVTAACMVVRRSVFEQLGGFDEAHLTVAFNDVDLCLRARDAGWKVVWTPHAVLTHHESVSRGYDLHVRPKAFGDEVAHMERRWGHVLRSDPAYNPNLSLESPDFEPAFPPRSPWWAPGRLSGPRAADEP